MSNRVLYITYINIVLYAFCFQMQRPMELFIVDKLVKGGRTLSLPHGQHPLSLSHHQHAIDNVASEYASLQAFFSFVQSIGTLVMGSIIIDKFGVKGGFIVAFLSGGLSYYFLSIATDIKMLYISKMYVQCVCVCVCYPKPIRSKTYMSFSPFSCSNLSF